MVRDRGIEPLTPSVSRKCSTPELTAHSGRINYPEPASPASSKHHPIPAQNRSKRPIKWPFIAFPRGASPEKMSAVFCPKTLASPADSPHIRHRFAADSSEKIGKHWQTDATPHYRPEVVDPRQNRLGCSPGRGGQTEADFFRIQEGG